MTAAVGTLTPSFGNPWRIDVFIMTIMSVISGIFGPFLTADSDGDEYSDLDLSEEERAALEDDDEDSDDNEEEDLDGDDPDPGDPDDQGDDDEDGPAADDDDPDEVEDPDPDPDEQEDDDPDGGDDPEKDGGDSEDDADPDGEEKREKTDADSDTGADDTDSKPVDIESVYKDKIAALDQKLDDGDIDFDEYKKEMLSLGESRTRDMVREEMARTTAENAWKAEQDAFFSENGYLKDNPIVYQSYAREVNRLLEDKAWTNKPGPDILAEAKKNIDSAFGIKPGEKSEPKPEKKEKTPGQKAVDKAKKANAKKAGPKTLKDVPAADKNTDGAFDHLDELDGLALESAIAKMTPAEREAYENAI